MGALIPFPTRPRTLVLLDRALADLEAELSLARSRRDAETSMRAWARGQQVVVGLLHRWAELDRERRRVVGAASGGEAR